MHQNLAAIHAAKQLTLSTAGTAASVASLSVQLNQPHAFLYLQLPLWFFFVSMTVLAFIGAFLALMTDYMRNRGTRTGKFVTALTVGLVLSFVILPTLIETPSVGWLQVTAFFGAFSGTILTYIVVRLFSDEQLHEAVLQVLKDSIIKLLKGLLLSASLVDALNRAKKRWFGGDK